MQSQDTVCKLPVMAKPEKGWTKKVRKRTTRRREQLERCGPVCYLEPGTGERGSRPKYPVCSKNSCEPTCGGTQAAFNRARMQRNKKVERKAKRLGRKLGCRWAKTA